MLWAQYGVLSQQAAHQPGTLPLFMVRAVHALSKMWPKSYSFNSVFLRHRSRRLSFLYHCSVALRVQTKHSPPRSQPLRIPSWAGRLLEALLAASVSGVSARFRMVQEMSFIKCLCNLPGGQRCCLRPIGIARLPGTKLVLTSHVRENSYLHCWKICSGWCSNWLDLNGLDVIPWAWQGPYYRHGHHIQWHCLGTKLWPRTVTGKKDEEGEEQNRSGP